MNFPSLDFLAIVNLMGVVQGFLLAVTFWVTGQGDRRSNRLLSLLLLTGVLTTFEIFASYTGIIKYFPALINTTEWLDFAFGPLTYFYTLSLIRPNFKWKNKWLHFIPAIVFLILRMPYFLQSPEYKLQDVYQVYHLISTNPVPYKKILWFPTYHFGGFWLDLMVRPFMIGYQAYSLYLIYRFTKEKKESFWKSSNRTLRRLNWMMLFLAFSQCVIALISFASDDDLGDIYIATLVAVIYYIIGYWVILDARLLSPRQLEGELEKKKYEKSGLDDALAVQLVQKLLLYMETEKPYLNGDLSLSSLAEKLKLSPHQLSQLLNDRLNKKFNDFVNEYRVTALASKLQDTTLANVKIEELAFDCGFNSKSVFNTAFKKTMGITPSQYRKSPLSSSEVIR